MINVSIDSIEAAKILSDVAMRLPDNGHDDRRRDARHLLALAMGRGDSVLPHETIAITKSQRQKLNQLIDRRCKGEPISRIRGFREFYGLDFALNRATLDPRSDSEVVVKTALDWLRDKQGTCLNPSLLDLGTGSGCLLLAVLKNLPKNFFGDAIGIDIDPDAIAMARHNAENLGLAPRVNFKPSDWDSALNPSQRFDVIISNPPYIPAPELDTLMDEVQLFDPRLALDGGSDGLVAWRKIAPIIARRLTNKGTACVEIGQGQEGDVEAIFAAQNMVLIEARHDLCGILRCLRFAKK